MGFNPGIFVKDENGKKVFKYFTDCTSEDLEQAIKDQEIKTLLICGLSAVLGVIVILVIGAM